MLRKKQDSMLLEFQTAKKLEETLIQKIETLSNFNCDEAILLIKQIIKNIKDEYHFSAPSPKGKKSLLLLPFSPLGGQYHRRISRSVYQSLFLYTKLAYLFEKRGTAKDHAFKLAALFGNKQKALEYINKYAETNKSRIPTNQISLIYEASAAFSLPPANCNFEAWRDFCQRADYMINVDFRNILPIADIIDEIINKDIAAQKRSKEEKESYAEKQAKIKVIKERLSPKIEEWKKLKSKHGTLTPDERLYLDKLNQEISVLKVELSYAYAGTPLARADLDMLRAYAERYMVEEIEVYRYFVKHGLTRHDYFEKFVKLDRSKAGINIPDITIDGSLLGCSGFYLKKVNPQNNLEAARAACFGKLTQCCQSLSGEQGEPCTIHGLTSPNGGLYLLCKGDVNEPKLTDEVCGGSWIWRSTTGNCVFDSIEVHPDFLQDQNGVNGNEIAKMMFGELACQMVKKSNVNQVNFGESSGISSQFGTPLHIFNNEKPESFVDYVGFSDAYNQQIVAHKDIPYLRYKGATGKENQAAWDKETNEFIRNHLKENSAIELRNIPILKQMVEFAVFHDITKLRKMLTNEFTIFSREKGEELNNYIENLEKYYQTTRKLLREKKEIQKNKLFEIIEQLAAEGIDLNISFPESKDTILIRALKQKDIYLIRKLLKRKDVDINRVVSGTTAFRWAIKWNASLEIIELFLQRADLDINSSGKDGMTPLMYAIEQQNKKLVSLLLDAGARIDIQDKQKKTAFDYCQNNPELIEMLEEENKKRKHLHQSSLLYSQQPSQSKPMPLDQNRYPIVWSKLDTFSKEVDALILSSYTREPPMEFFSQSMLKKIKNYFDTQHEKEVSDLQVEIRLRALQNILNHMKEKFNPSLDNDVKKIVLNIIEMLNTALPTPAKPKRAPKI